MLLVLILAMNSALLGGRPLPSCVLMIGVDPETNSADREGLPSQGHLNARLVHFFTSMFFQTND